LYAKDRTAVFTLATPLEGAQTLVVRLRHESPHTGHNIGCFRISLTAQEPPPLADGTGLPREVADALRADPELLGEDQRAQIFNYYRSIAPALADVRNQIAQLESQRSALVAQFP